MTKFESTLRAIAEQPTQASIAWRDIENLFKSLGATIHERKGSRILIELEGRRFHVHRPHNRKEAGKELVNRVREFLRETGHL